MSEQRGDIWVKFDQFRQSFDNFVGKLFVFWIRKVKVMTLTWLDFVTCRASLRFSLKTGKRYGSWLRCRDFLSPNRGNGKPRNGTVRFGMVRSGWQIRSHYYIIRYIKIIIQKTFLETQKLFLHPHSDQARERIYYDLVKSMLIKLGSSKILARVQNEI